MNLMTRMRTLTAFALTLGLLLSTSAVGAQTSVLRRLVFTLLFPK